MEAALNFPLLKTKEQSAIILGVSVVTLDRLTKSKALNSIKVGRFVRFREEDLKAYIRQNATLKTANSY